MCVSFCSRTGRLFWNHEDCQPVDCEFAAETHGRCEDCRHRHDGVCGLTRAPLPATGGCCHWNVVPVVVPQVVTRAMLAPLGIGLEETEEFVLRRLDAPYELGADGEAIVDPAGFVAPFCYGKGSDHLPEAELDWSAWLGQWCLEE